MKASDLTGAVTAEILGVESKEIKEGEGQQLVVKLQGQEKGWVLNSTNANSLIKKHGDDYSKWVGKTVTIASVAVDFEGKSTQGIRIVG